MPFDGGLVAKPKFSFLRWFRSGRVAAEPEIIRPLTVLDKLGLIPVPAEVLVNHKAQVAAEFFASRGRSESMFRWYEYYQANTRMFRGTNDSGPTADRYNNDVLAAVKGLGHQGVGTRTVPRAVYGIANAVTRRADKLGLETEKVAGFFYLDPYVSLVYRENGEVKRACLAIWDGNRVLHIATLI